MLLFFRRTTPLYRNLYYLIIIILTTELVQETNIPEILLNVATFLLGALTTYKEASIEL